MIKHDLPKVGITYKGFFDFDQLYNMIYAFLVENQFVAKDFGGSGDKTIYETKYIDVGDTPKNILTYWEAKKELKDNTFYRYVMNIKIRGLAITKSEVMVEGKKVAGHQGEVSVEIKSAVETDFQNKWENHWLLKHLLKRYDERIMKKEYKTEEDNLFATLMDIHTRIKRFFKLRGGEQTAEIAPIKQG